MLSPVSILGLALVLLGLYLALQMHKRTRGFEKLEATVLRVDSEVAEGLDHKPVTVYVPVYEYRAGGELRQGCAKVKLEHTKLSAGDKVSLRYNPETGDIAPAQEVRIARGICAGVTAAGLLILLLVWLEEQGLF